MGRIENAKDKTVGKVMETAGKLTKDAELEFSGKFRSMTSQVKDKITDVKEDVVQEGNKLIDKTKTKMKDHNE